MRVLKRGAATLGVLLGATAAVAPVALGHGSMSDPISRVLACYEEGPENPQSDVCKAVVAAGGTQPLYDWNEVNIPDAAGRHREIIPDGRLCSAGRDKYRGLDLARSDWRATALTSGAEHRFRYRGTAPHRGSFELYLTRDGYDPTQPLKWSDLEPEPFLRVTDPALVDGYYVMDGRLPSGKTGRHLIYSIWQRSDSPEAFYACSDVTFGGAEDPPDDGGGEDPPDDGGGEDPPDDGGGGDPPDDGGEPSGLSATFATSSSWDGGYVGAYTIGNGSTEGASGWTLEFELDPSATITSFWNAQISRSAGHVTVLPVSWTNDVAPGQSVQFGFQVEGDARPTGCKLNGGACG